MRIDSPYESSTLVEYGDGETEWLGEAEFDRFDMPEDARVTALTVTLDAPADGITDEWRKVTGDALVTQHPRAVSWDTLDESNDRDVSEFILDLED